MNPPLKNVLVLGTRNSTISIMAEALFNHLPLPLRKFRAYSAGSSPCGYVDPVVLSLLQANGITTEALHSKSWDEFLVTDSPVMDFVITLRDPEEGVYSPVWPGQPAIIHWAIPDIGIVQDEQERHALARQALVAINGRIDLFANLPFEKLDHLAASADPH